MTGTGKYFRRDDKLLGMRVKVQEPFAKVDCTINLDFQSSEILESEIPPIPYIVQIFTLIPMGVYSRQKSLYFPLSHSYTSNPNLTKL